MNRKVRTRFAPSPTGMLHLGGIRTALYNYLLAKKNNGDFILRIEDTDQTRFVEGAQDYIIKTLEWLDIKPNEGVVDGGPHGPYIQSQRKHIYKKYAQELIEKRWAYYAFDTSEDLEKMHKRLEEAHVSSPQYNATTRDFMKNSLTLSKEEVEGRIKNGEKYVIRFKTEKNNFVRFYDEVRGWIKVDTNTLDDKILLKSDGMATYHLASIVDDYLMDISHVIRGEEWLPSAPLHVLLYKAFGWEEKMPLFVHLPLLLKPTGQGKLSKRDADEGGFPIFPLSWFDNKNNKIVEGFREKGFLPEAIINAIVLLGWNPGSNIEIMSREEMVNLFSLNKLCKSGARFNYKKFEWFNHHYLQKKENLTSYIEKELKTLNIKYPKEKIEEIICLIKERCFLTTDIWEKSKPFFFRPEKYNIGNLEKEKIENSLIWIQSFLKKIEKINWEEEILHEECKIMLEENKLSFKDVMPTFRLLLFGEINGPDVIKSIKILGLQETVTRVELFKKLHLEK